MFLFKGLSRALGERMLVRALRRQGPWQTPVQLHQRRIYILPTGYGYTFALMLVVMFLWSINYSNSMGFALTFLLGAVALNAMWRTHSNLLGVRVLPEHAEPVFAGQEAHFYYCVENSENRHRYDISLQGSTDIAKYADIFPGGHALYSVSLPAEHRGPLRPGPVRIETRFPLGLFRAWSWLEFAQICLVYPKPEGKRPLPVKRAIQSGAGSGEQGVGSEDFAGLRSYTAGDSPRHIAWRATARIDSLLVKRFSDQVRTELWLDWWSLVSVSTEARLSQLCQWVLKAETEGRNYGLRIPGAELAPARGEGHRRHCLELLALYGLSDSSENWHGRYSED